MTPFKIDVPQTKLNSIRAKVRDYEWHEMPPWPMVSREPGPTGQTSNS